MSQVTTAPFDKGTHNKLTDEIVPPESAIESVNWLTRNGRLELSYGRQSQGGDGVAGKIYGEHTGYKVDGTSVRFRKADTVVQYYDGSAWQDTITGLTASDVTFANYQSLAGSFVYVFSPDDGIHKIVTANPGSYTSLYDEDKNFKGYGLIDKSRARLWGRKKDPTGLYGSWIDNQEGVSGSTGVYTSVSSEAVTAVESGTLAFKAGGATRTCFGVTITHTASGEVFTDDFNGILTGDAGGSGTINYTTGAFTITGQTGAGTADYQWENSNLRGVTDFSYSASRLAGEGFIVRQDEGGDKIRVVLPYDGAYISVKSRSAYQFTPDPEDTDPTNELIRADIGVDSLRAAVSTSFGVVYMNTSNQTNPHLAIVERNPFGDNFLTKELFPQYDFSGYEFDDVMLGSWDRYILVACKEDSNENNVLLLCDTKANTVDKTSYGIRAYTKDGGYLYGGDPVSKTSYELFTGFDDMGIRVENSWIGAPSLLETTRLKKVKRMRFAGIISPDQTLEVSVSRDNGDWLLIGTIRGDQDYVDYTTSYAIGTTLIGTSTIGGDDEIPVYRFFMEIKLRGEKFRQRKVKLEAKGIGYLAIEKIVDFDIYKYQNKLPKTYRIKQNVSIDGADTDEDYATFS